MITDRLVITQPESESGLTDRCIDQSNGSPACVRSAEQSADHQMRQTVLATRLRLRRQRRHQKRVTRLQQQRDAEESAVGLRHAVCRLSQIPDQWLRRQI